MLSLLSFLSVQHRPPRSSLVVAELFYITKRPRALTSQLPVYGGDDIKWRRAQSCSFSSSTSFSCTTVYAVERDSEEFEIDPDKAKDALQQLDQQLQTLSKKKVTPPKIRAKDVELMRDQMTAEEMPKISGSFLTYSAFVLLAFTIFYNVLFYSVIKPAIDGPESPPTDTEERVSSTAILQFLPTMPGVFIQS